LKFDIQSAGKMCDIDRYSTGVLLVQISAGLLASVFFAKTSVMGAEDDLPVAEAVTVPEAEVTVANIEGGASVVPVAGDAPGVYGQRQLRRRAAGLERARSTSDYRTIEMSAEDVQSVRFHL
jgi:hypothetical protein